MEPYTTFDNNSNGCPTFACSYSISMTVDVYDHLVPGGQPGRSYVVK